MKEWRLVRRVPLDMDEMLKKAQAGGSMVGREKVWSLEFVDDSVIKK
jgi:hypothetical protein